MVVRVVPPSAPEYMLTQQSRRFMRYPLRERGVPHPTRLQQPHHCVLQDHCPPRFSCRERGVFQRACNSCSPDFSKIIAVRKIQSARERGVSSPVRACSNEAASICSKSPMLKIQCRERCVVGAQAVQQLVRLHPRNRRRGREEGQGYRKVLVGEGLTSVLLSVHIHLPLRKGRRGGGGGHPEIGRNERSEGWKFGERHKK